MAQIGLTFLLKEEAPQFAEKFIPFLSKIEDIDAGRWSLDHCLSDIYEGNLIVWLVFRDNEIVAAITTRICQAKIKYLVIEDIAGDYLSDWVTQAHDAIEKFARSIGCAQMTTGGRAGWEKYFRQFGFTKSRVEGFKNLEAL
jgi:hypothetical protein